jgi:hypothetical protein
MFTAAIPFVRPLQVTFVGLGTMASPEVDVIVVDDVAVQPFELVTVTVNVLVDRPDKSSVVLPLFQAKVYGEIAPLTVKSIEPLTALQLALKELVEIETADEPLTVIEDVAVQLPEPVTVTV